MREIYIFDIDGCIMPPIFSNFNSNQSRKKIVKIIIKNGNKINLYPDFSKFFETYCVQAESVFFITGRKESEFGKLTENQLESLANIKTFQIIYYPEGKSHKIRKYFTWKVKKIKEVIKDTIKAKRLNEGFQENFKFKIFDDMNDYFPQVREFEDKFKVQIHMGLIDNENNWNNEL